MRTRRKLIAAALVTVAAIPVGTAFADIIANDLDPTVDVVAEVMPLNVGGPAGTTRLYVVPTKGDGKSGCNLTGGTTLTLSVASSDTAVATVSPASVTFTSCGQTVPLAVAPIGLGTATVSITQTGNTSGGSFDLGTATFTVHVAPPANTAPGLHISGVEPGASYPKGGVPSAVCEMTDAEDGNSSFPATLGTIRGPYAVDGIGQQSADCSYTDAGGLTATTSLVYAIGHDSAGRHLRPRTGGAGRRQRLVPQRRRPRLDGR